MSESQPTDPGPSSDDMPTTPNPVTPAPTDAVSDQVGPYRIIRRIDGGGMGDVFLAEQAEPVRRQVALKFVRSGSSSESVLARFEQERQALAMMSHEYIAKVFDAGVAPNGQPFFAMELVEGEPIDRYCQNHGLSVRERVELFRKVCDGVQHAHQKGVIHRDLKPGNVLVVEREGKHTPKIIDFGLARAIDGQLIDDALVTEQGQMMGTPEFMSPEQARGDLAQIDTRTDVYSLGVMLYQLLCGQLPFPAAYLRREGLLRIREIIDGEEPKKPSTRISVAEDETDPEFEKSIGLDRRALSRSLRGDLDWIVMRAMEKKPDRRYASPSGLELDLGRFLGHEPVEAGPPTFGYRFSKFVRKNRIQVTAAAIVVLALTLGLVSSLLFADRAQAAEKLATTRADDLEEQTDLFEQLSGVVLFENAEAKAADLVPAWPEKIGLIDSWLQGDVAQLRDLRPRIRSTLRQLEDRALPTSPEVRQAPRLEHPMFEEYERLERELSEWTAATAVARSGVLDRPDLPQELREAPLEIIDGFAWMRVDPEDPERIIGEAPIAVAAAERAVEMARERRSPLLPNVLDTLAWAQFRAGLVDECMETIDRAVAAARGESVLPAQRSRTLLQSELDRWPTAVARTRREIAAIERQLPPQQSLRFTSDPEGEAFAFLYSTLSRLELNLDLFFDDVVPAVEARRVWADRLASIAHAHPNAGASWTEVSESLSTAGRSGVAAAYREWFSGPDAIRLAPQDGLVPIGINPATGLWEFYHLRSAWDGRSDPAEIAIPRHGEDGRIEVAEATGMVFVLIPGGTFRMGAQSSKPDAPNYDRSADEIDEQPVHELRLRPFFVARHEITKRQWQRLTGGGRPSGHPLGSVYRSDFAIVDDRYPVENVFWTDTRAMLVEHGLQLPTEAQWEFACRAGTETRWSTGSEAASLTGFANVLDRTAEDANAFGGGGTLEIVDGHVNTAPVGSFSANPFGLHDTHGNVREWCLDEFGDYEQPMRVGDGLRVRGDGSGFRVLRGGSFSEPAVNARSSFRDRVSPNFRNLHVGARAARAIQD